VLGATTNAAFLPESESIAFLNFLEGSVSRSRRCGRSRRVGGARRAPDQIAELVDSNCASGGLRFSRYAGRDALEGAARIRSTLEP
jgi:hypothetical protein